MTGELILQHRPPGSETYDTEAVVEAEVPVVWWDKKWIPGSANGLSLGQEELVPRGINESPGREPGFFV